VDLAEEIKTIRRECFLSQVDFAKEIGVTQITITRWETGKSVPNYTAMKRLLAYCKAKGINTESLCYLWRENGQASVNV